MKIKELKPNELRDAEKRIEEKTDGKTIFTFKDACMSVMFDLSGLSGVDSFATIDYLNDYGAISYDEHERLVEQEKLNARMMSYIMWGSIAIIGVPAYGLNELFLDIDSIVNIPDDSGTIHPKVGEAIYNEMHKPNEQKKPDKPNPFKGMS